MTNSEIDARIENLEILHIHLTEAITSALEADCPRFINTLVEASFGVSLAIESLTLRYVHEQE